jgi:hypothetical protein
LRRRSKTTGDFIHEPLECLGSKLAARPHLRGLHNALLCETIEQRSPAATIRSLVILLCRSIRRRQLQGVEMTSDHARPTENKV